MNQLTGKIALITGASKGIGASIATHFAAAGATVIVNYSSSQSAAEAIVKEIEKSGAKAWSLQADFSKKEDVDRCFAEIRSRHGRLDVLVNNAGVFRFNTLEAFTVEEFYRHFNLNVLGLLLATKGAVELMGSEGCSILNISSIVATMAPARATVYAASKGTMESATTALSKELGPRRIRVNSLAPGGILTEGTELSSQTETFKEFERRTPLGRLGQPGHCKDSSLLSLLGFLLDQRAAYRGGWWDDDIGMMRETEVVREAIRPPAPSLTASQLCRRIQRQSPAA